MASFLRSLARKSWAYPIIRGWHNARNLRQWAADDQARLEFYQGLIKPGDLVFDIGANFGNRSKVFLRLGARVVAFEPQPSCAKVLQSVLGKDPRFHLEQRALGNEAGVVDMHISTASVLSTLSGEWIDSVSRTGRFGDEQWTSRETVQVSTFDDAIKLYGEPSFAKIDVEGYERQVIAGLSHPIAGGSVEFASEALADILWCLDKLHARGTYRFQFSSAESMRWSWPMWCNLEQAKSALEAMVRSNPQSWGDVYFQRQNQVT